MAIVTVHAAEDAPLRLIEQALRGEEVIIARDEKPVVRLVPVDAPKPRWVAGTLKGEIEVPESFFDPLPEDELKLWEGG